MRGDDGLMVVLTGVVLVIAVATIMPRDGSVERMLGLQRDIVLRDDTFRFYSTDSARLDVVRNDIGVDFEKGDRLRITQQPQCGVARSARDHILLDNITGCSGDIALAYCVDADGICSPAAVTVSIDGRIPPESAPPDEPQAPVVLARPVEPDGPDTVAQIDAAMRPAGPTRPALSQAPGLNSPALAEAAPQTRSLSRPLRPVPQPGTADLAGLGNAPEDAVRPAAPPSAARQAPRLDAVERLTAPREREAVPQAPQSSLPDVALLDRVPAAPDRAPATEDAPIRPRNLMRAGLDDTAGPRPTFQDPTQRMSLAAPDGAAPQAPNGLAETIREGIVPHVTTGVTPPPTLAAPADTRNIATARAPSAPRAVVEARRPSRPVQPSPSEPGRIPVALPASPGAEPRLNAPSATVQAPRQDALDSPPPGPLAALDTLKSPAPLGTTLRPTVTPEPPARSLERREAPPSTIGLAQIAPPRSPATTPQRPRRPAPDAQDSAAFEAPPTPQSSSPRQASPGLAPPNVASPSLTSPSLTSPSLTPPDPASPGLTPPDPASPDLASPGLASPDPASPRLASPSLASPSLASPDPASPGLTSPNLVSPDLAAPSALPDLARAAVPPLDTAPQAPAIQPAAPPTAPPAAPSVPSQAALRDRAPEPVARSPISRPEPPATDRQAPRLSPRPVGQNPSDRPGLASAPQQNRTAETDTAFAGLLVAPDPARPAPRPAPRPVRPGGLSEEQAAPVVPPVLSSAPVAGLRDLPRPADRLPAIPGDPVTPRPRNRAEVPSRPADPSRPRANPSAAAVSVRLPDTDQQRQSPTTARRAITAPRIAPVDPQLVLPAALIPSEPDPVPSGLAPQTLVFCQPALSLAIARGQMIALSIAADCLAGETVVVEHSGLRFSQRLDGAGTAAVVVPALNEKAEISVLYGNGESVSSSIAVSGMDQVARAAIVWSGGYDLNLHLFAPGLDDDAAHIWQGAPRDYRRARLGGGGFLVVLGDPALGGYRAQVISVPLRRSGQPAVMRLELELAATTAACLEAIEFSTVWADARRRAEPQAIRLPFSACPKPGEILRNGGLRDLVLARR
ncbi:MAG: hypothetical protein AAGC92_12790 [Pseudomonadota bacterium]